MKNINSKLYAGDRCRDSRLLTRLLHVINTDKLTNKYPTITIKSQEQDNNLDLGLLLYTHTRLTAVYYYVNANRLTEQCPIQLDT